MHGRIVLESKPCKGSTFFILLPTKSAGHIGRRHPRPHSYRQKAGQDARHPCNSRRTTGGNFNRRRRHRPAQTCQPGTIARDGITHERPLCGRRASFPAYSRFNFNKQKISLWLAPVYLSATIISFASTTSAFNLPADSSCKSF